MKKFYIHTMGCKSNQFESSIIKENLIKNGYLEIKQLEDADIFILNSCTVTHKSDNEAFYLLRNAKNKNKNLKTILTGCIAQVEKEKLLQKDFIDIVIGNDEKLKMFEILNELQTDNMPCAVADIMTLAEFNKQVLEDTTKTRASLKIQDGCDNRCSYCIIPFARGKSRSADISFIIEQINNFSEHGFKEVVFTGIHIGQWGKDIGMELLDLLKAVETQTSIERYRLGSLNPLEISKEMLDFLKHSKKFCPHFHLSLQSLCDKTLKNMNRKYTLAQSLEVIEKLHKNFNLPYLGCDIIVGFPNENEDDFIETYENLKRARLSSIHCFPYSKREKTPAYFMENQIQDLLLLF